MIDNQTQVSITTPLSRQVRRQEERRAKKQPTEMSQKDWHMLNGFPKIKTRKKPRKTR